MAKAQLEERRRTLVCHSSPLRTRRRLRPLLLLLVAVEHLLKETELRKRQCGEQGKK